jgi:hypothetical protein
MTLETVEGAREAVGGAYDVLHLLPADPDEAMAALAMVEQALAHPGSQPEGWTGPASYVFTQPSQ